MEYDYFEFYAMILKTDKYTLFFEYDPELDERFFLIVRNNLEGTFVGELDNY